MRKNMSFLAVLLALTFIVGCGNQENDQTEGKDLNNQITILEERVQELEEENNALLAENAELKAEITAYENEEYPQVETPGQENGEEELPVFGFDESGERVLASSVVVKSDEPLINKMQFLADELGKTVFDGLKIEARSIDKIEGKEILTVNLLERTEDTDKKGWVNSYFQGSTGGGNTEAAITETFLQREYGGRWIQGIIVTLDGEKIVQDHVPNLSQPIFR